jgi:hypothetical protein
LNPNIKGKTLGHMESSETSIYLYYHHSYCDKQTQFKRGTFDQLQQRIGVGFDNSHKSSVVELFDWSPEEEVHLENFLWERDRVEL